jgi:RNA polymerase sigma factor (sigma-70 family)
MTVRTLTPVLRRLCHRLAGPGADAVSDAQLLDRFVRARDEAAFELLVRRHGPMVLGVCRRVLRHEQDAEDAFQAALLILARKAGSITARVSVGGWLYQVAYRVALRARQGAARRPRPGTEAGVPETVVDPRPWPGPEQAELRTVLDAEISRLPEKYRAPLVLSYLEGLSNERAARQLGWPPGTLKTRLASARRRLGARLVQRGLGPGAGVAIVPLPPADLVGATVRAAALVVAENGMAAGAVSAPVAALTRGVLRAMLISKVKAVAVVVAGALLLGAGGAASYRALAGERGPAKPAADNPAARVARLKQAIRALEDELREAEQAAARERPPAPQDPVARLFGDVTITREELGNYLIGRMTKQQLQAYVNRRILEHAARKAKVTVTPEELEKAVAAERSELGVDAPAFEELLRTRYNKGLAEWKEDVVWPRLILERLSGGKDSVGERFEELRKEARVELLLQPWDR